MTSPRLLACSIALTVAASAFAQDTAAPPETKTVRIPGTTVEFELVACPGGETTDENGQTRGIDPLWVLSTEVTWDLYDIFVFALDEADAGALDAVSRPSKPYVPPDRGYGHAGYPAIGMTRDAAEAFCVWLEARTGLQARLPTPEEWTFLASADQADTPAPEQDLSETAWFNANTDDTTQPVGRRSPNAFGLHDTLGNVAEWVMTDTGKPIAMGGSFRDAGEDCTPRSTQRQRSSWNTSDPQIPKSRWWLADCGWVGFRFVVELDDKGDADDD